MDPRALEGGGLRVKFEGAEFAGLHREIEATEHAATCTNFDGHAEGRGRVFGHDEGNQRATVLIGLLLERLAGRQRRGDLHLCARCRAKPIEADHLVGGEEPTQ